MGPNSVGKDFKNDVLKIEKQNLDDFYIRVFVDEDVHKAIIIC